MSTRARGGEKEKARKFWARLGSWERGELGNQLVLGDLDWRDWFDKKPSRAFWDEVDELRMAWEAEQSAPAHAWSKVFS